MQIKEAKNLPADLSHYVFCQYSFFNISDMLVVAPTMDVSHNNEIKKKKNSSNKQESLSFTSQNSFKFDHVKVCY